MLRLGGQRILSPWPRGSNTSFFCSKCLITLELLYFLLLLYFQFKADPGQSKLGKRNCGTNARFAVYCKVVISCTAIYQEHYIKVWIEISVEFEMLPVSR